MKTPSIGGNLQKRESCQGNLDGTQHNALLKPLSCIKGQNPAFNLMTLPAGQNLQSDRVASYGNDNDAAYVKTTERKQVYGNQ
jgi:hypothetical protein